MPEKFIFHGQTTFIDKPKDTIIQNFQNTYITGDGSTIDKVNQEIIKLVELVLESKSLSKGEKEETVQALDSIAGQVKEQKGNKIVIKGILKSVSEVVTKATDIAIPSLAIIAAILKLLGLG